MARLTERAFENAVVRLRDGQGALGKALDVGRNRAELANQMLAAGGQRRVRAMPSAASAPSGIMTYHECAMMEVEMKFRALMPSSGCSMIAAIIHQVAPEKHRQSGEARPQRFPRAGGLKDRTSTMWPARVVCTFPKDVLWPSRCFPRMT
ncbi:MAG: hypothetical protein ACLSGS_07955 [Adlercreutzia sp.]